MVGVDPNDPATDRCVPPPGNDYTRYLRRAGLQGARIGIPRANFYRTTTRPDTGATIGGLAAPQLAVMEDAIQILRNEGATIVDPADIPSYRRRHAGQQLRGVRHVRRAGQRARGSTRRARSPSSTA